MFDLKPDGSFIRVCGGKVVIKNKYQILYLIIISGLNSVEKEGLNPGVDLNP